MGYLDGTFIMKDDDVSSFGEHVHEKAKHVIHGNQLQPCELGKKKSHSQNRSALHFHLHTTLHH